MEEVHEKTTDIMDSCCVVTAVDDTTSIDMVKDDDNDSFHKTDPHPPPVQLQLPSPMKDDDEANNIVDHIETNDKDNDDDDDFGDFNVAENCEKQQYDHHIQNNSDFTDDSRLVVLDDDDTTTTITPPNIVPSLDQNHCMDENHLDDFNNKEIPSSEIANIMESTNNENLDDFNDTPTTPIDEAISMQQSTMRPTTEIKYEETSQPMEQDYDNCNNEEEEEEEEEKEQNDDDFGDFDTAQAAPMMTSLNHEPIPVHETDDNDDNFGDFDAAVVSPEMDEIPTLSLSPNNNNNNNNNNVTSIKQENVEEDDDDFGNFDSATTDATSANHVIDNKNNTDDDDDDDFGDFDTAEVTSVMATSNEPISGNNNNENDDDDDFGDFDEAPVSVPTNHEIVDATKTGVPTMDNSIPLDDDIDPIVVKVRNTVPEIFIHYTHHQDSNNNTATMENNGNDPIPRFDDNEIISIESALASLEIETPMTSKVLSQSSIYPIEKLFTTVSSDSAENVITPSRYIISNKTMSSPTMYPFSRRIFISDRMIRIKAMNHGGRGTGENHMNGSNKQNGIKRIDHEQNQNDDATGPSEQAKALLERIPDLSYMLSTKLCMPDVK